MRRQTTLAISCGKVLKVKAKTMIFTQVQSDDEDDRKSVASSNYINNSTEEDFAQIYHVTLIEDGEIEEEDAEDAPVELEEGVKATVDELREVNLGNTEDPRPIYTSASLTQEEEEAYIMLLHEFKDVFAWSYKKMPGLDPKVAVHHLSVRKGARPVKQGQRRFRSELIPLIETEVNKLIEVGFIREVKYPMWISSIVPVRKKNGQIRDMRLYPSWMVHSDTTKYVWHQRMKNIRDFSLLKVYIATRSFEGIFLRCLSDDEKDQAMEEAHSEVCGAQQSGPKLHFRIKRMGYYWLTMVKDCIDYAKRCQACQFHANLIHQPPEPLYPTVASWPFDAWGLDVVGPMTKSSEGHLYILAATDYFSKWAEAVPVKEVKKENVMILSTLISSTVMECPGISSLTMGNPFVIA
ncbi:UNVERIFIED_CONTAM: hypothetical protein Slati_3936900 [Sesamum latifolium]|uniref:Integrase catalytic domain-containing protein n=1 Tax=Sesamum latifolium TaxID=2727402 RepID=A0AAW2TP79_9LAMI